MLFYQFQCIKIGFLDDSSNSGKNTRINNAFLKYKSFVESYNGNVKFETYEYNYQADDFTSVWKNIENNETGVDVVVSSCNFLLYDTSIEKYTIISNSSITVWCGIEDYLSMCIKNIYFYSSSKAVIYRCIYYYSYYTSC